MTANRCVVDFLATFISMGIVSPFRQSLVRAIMNTTNSKNSVVVGVVHVFGDPVVTMPVAIPLSS